MGEWIDTLPELNLHNIKPMFPEADRARDAGVKLPDERSYRRHGHHATKNALAISAAAQVLDRLPEPGESIHIIMAGNFANWHFVPAILKLAAPATIRELTLATLGYDRSGTVQLADLLDNGKIGTCTLLISVFFQAQETQLWGWLTHELLRRNCRILAARNHCKLMLFRMSDGRHFIMESSANLRSCRNHEQATLTADEGLYQFHAAWIDELFTRAAP